jgi:hypothetical protein
MGPWWLAVARVTVMLEAAATTETGVPTTARLDAMGAAVGARLRRARRWTDWNIYSVNGIPFSTC